ncbi:nucleolar protein 58-like [Benincasa hispida]|uniref:nucleolar protein 58-like n=1 Tax=Benincasa hispida TaxID=102211 RepID=UPI001900443E|nr:nucleolar protein 58-like [Benincasa hispida]
MENEGWLPKDRVVNQPLPSKEKMSEASQRSALAVSDPKETIQTESYEGPIRVALEEVEAKKQPKMAEGKKKRKSKGKRAEGDEEARPKKEKKEKKSSEKRERRREEKRLKKEVKRKRAKSLDVDGESTTARVEEGLSTQEKESAQSQEASMHIRTVATEDREDSDITPLMRHRKENATGVNK